MSPLFSQWDSTIFFNEFTVSINRTAVKDNNTENRFGFGAGVYHSSSDRKMVNFVFGFEYNRTSQFKEGMYESRFTHFTDLTCYIQSISLPLAARINFGRTTKFFVEAGFYLDINLKAVLDGTRHYFGPNEDWSGILITESEFRKETGVKTLNYGPSVGAGVKIPVAKHAILLKADYKYGIANLEEYHGTINNRYFRFMLGFKL